MLMGEGGMDGVVPIHARLVSLVGRSNPLGVVVLVLCVLEVGNVAEDDVSATPLADVINFRHC